MCWPQPEAAAGGWRLAAGGWRLAAGGWRLAAGGRQRQLHSVQGSLRQLLPLLYRCVLLCMYLNACNVHHHSGSRTCCGWSDSSNCS
jgi:hypothetical protein